MVQAVDVGSKLAARLLVDTSIKSDLPDHGPIFSEPYVTPKTPRAVRRSFRLPIPSTRLGPNIYVPEPLFRLLNGLFLGFLPKRSTNPRLLRGFPLVSF